MDSFSSGEDLIIKTRKAYTITKQRERWTEEEHNRFLEALKLYGRAWQRIEEHIGSKTAVQIRSHAQKFFSKLEKEALAKGVPIGEAFDIDIPPPRPKRKPSNPYPRKSSFPAPNLPAGTKNEKLSTFPYSSPCKQAVDLEQDPSSGRESGEEMGSKERRSGSENFSEVYTMPQEGHSDVSSAKKRSVPTTTALKSSCTFREFFPSIKEPLRQNTSQKLGPGENGGDLSGELSTDEMATNNYPKHIPVHVLDGGPRSFAQSSSPDMPFLDSRYDRVAEVQRHGSSSTNPAASAATEQQINAPRPVLQSCPVVPSHFTPLHPNQGDIRSLLEMSSTLSNLIVSTLLQHPAAHAAASFAAAFWPRATAEMSADSSAFNIEGFPARQVNSAPSPAAITAVTVAAATAWWAAHGLLHPYASFYPAFTGAPGSETPVPSMEISPMHAAKNYIVDDSLQRAPLHDQQPELKQFKPFEALHSASRSPTLSSSESEESGDSNKDSVSKHKPLPVRELQCSNKENCGKQVDRSSCGSHTPSSSEVETDALENHSQGKEDAKDPEENQPTVEATHRRSRSTVNMNDLWKEVSEEGKLAFQALFRREVLPQSFLPPHDLRRKEQQKATEDKQPAGGKDEVTLQLDLNCKTCESGTTNQALGSENSGEEELQTVALGHGKLKNCRTGFKPYKRCSIEAKETLADPSAQGEEKCQKRIRLEGEASSWRCTCMQTS